MFLRGIFRDVIFARNKESESFSGCLQRGVIPGTSRKGKRTEGDYLKTKGEKIILSGLADAKRKQRLSASPRPLGHCQEHKDPTIRSGLAYK